MRPNAHYWRRRSKGYRSTEAFHHVLRSTASKLVQLEHFLWSVGTPRAAGQRAAQRPHDQVSCAPQAHNGNAALAARTRRHVTVRCNRLSSTAPTAMNEQHTDVATSGTCHLGRGEAELGPNIGLSAGTQQHLDER